MANHGDIILSRLSAYKQFLYWWIWAFYTNTILLKILKFYHTHTHTHTRAPTHKIIRQNKRQTVWTDGRSSWTWTNGRRSLRGELVIASSERSPALHIRYYTANPSLSFPSANTLMLIQIYTHRSINAAVKRVIGNWLQSAWQKKNRPGKKNKKKRFTWCIRSAYFIHERSM